MNIAVVGTGYVGLVTGNVFRKWATMLLCVDIDKRKVEKMRNGIIPIYEPHLDVIFERNIKQGRLKFTDLAEAIKNASNNFPCIAHTTSWRRRQCRSFRMCWE